MVFFSCFCAGMDRCADFVLSVLLLDVRKHFSFRVSKSGTDDFLCRRYNPPRSFGTGRPASGTDNSRFCFSLGNALDGLQSYGGFVFEACRFRFAGVPVSAFIILRNAFGLSLVRNKSLWAERYFHHSCSAFFLPSAADLLKQAEISAGKLKKITVFSIVAIFGAALIHESAFLFMPLLFTFLGFLYYREKKLRLWSVIVAVSFAISLIFAGFYFSGTQNIARQLEDSWRPLYSCYRAGAPAEYLYGKRPLLFYFLLGKTDSRVSFVNIIQPLTIGASAEFSRFWENRFFLYLLPSYLSSFFIGVVFWCFIFFKPLLSARPVSRYPLFLDCLLLFSLLLPFILFMTTDWGRWLSNIFLVWTITACSLLRASASYKKDSRLDRILKKSFFLSFGYLAGITTSSSFAVLFCIERSGPFLAFSVLPFCFFLSIVILNRFWRLCFYIFRFSRLD